MEVVVLDVLLEETERTRLKSKGLNEFNGLSSLFVHISIQDGFPRSANSQL